MVKQDLSFGNVVELRSGDLCIYDNTLRFICLRKGKYLRDISSYNPTLRNIEFNGWDIVKVYEDYTLKEVLWEREKEPVLTEDEKVILRNISPALKWIARDKCGDLSFYYFRPKKHDNIWFGDDFESFNFYNHLFKFIEWEDDEPYFISDLL